MTRRRRFRPTASFASILVAAGLAGCTAAVPTANPYPPVPRAPVEIVPKPPVSATPLVWQPGHYEWNGTGYVWYPGIFVQQLGRRPLWQPGYWTRRERGWVWIPGHWA